MFKPPFFSSLLEPQYPYHLIYALLSNLTERRAMQMEAWLLLLSSCSSWCTQRRWWKTRPPACLCWRFRRQTRTWELMARSPTPSTVPAQTSSISTTGQVWCRLFGVKTRVLPLSVWVGDSIGTQAGSVLKRDTNISIVLSLFFRSSSLTSITLSFCHNSFLSCPQCHLTVTDRFKHLERMNLIELKWSNFSFRANSRSKFPHFMTWNM